MIRVFNWNARGLGSADKRRYLRDVLFNNHLDIVGIQETTKETFPIRTLNALSSSISHWIFKASQGSSGGILLGINDTKFSILNSWIMDFSISVHLKNKSDPFEWIFTVVYGPVLSSQRSTFLTELRSISGLCSLPWLIGGDFNLIRARHERQGPSFNYILSNRFNNVISDLDLMELPIHNCKFTWARSVSSPSRSLLDRFFL